ncbi:MAG: cell division ATP-binding protein FtsE [Gemmatimonadetes bacterium]|nr:cell division ATP-binding protein FtsE [Gemmatimonadota bacterium]
MITVTKVGKQYRKGQWGLRDIGFGLEKGEFAVLTGHSGAGKTTLMKLLSFEEKPTEGEIALEEFSSKRIRRRQIPHLRRRIGPVFQDFRLLRERTAFENVAIVLRATGAKRSGINRRVMRALAAVGLSSKTTSMPHELSGGEQQRVAIARAMINDPFVLLADEPTGNLDEVNTREIFRLLKKVSASGTAVLVATHDLSIASEFRARTLILERGHLVQDVTPEIVLPSTSPTLAGPAAPAGPRAAVPGVAP